MLDGPESALDNSGGERVKFDLSDDRMLVARVVTGDAQAIRLLFIDSYGQT